MTLHILLSRLVPSTVHFNGPIEKRNQFPSPPINDPKRLRKKSPHRVSLFHCRRNYRKGFNRNADREGKPKVMYKDIPCAAVDDKDN